VTPKVKLAAGGPTAASACWCSSGQADIGLQQVSELIVEPEVEVIGMLPAELQLTTIYSAGVDHERQEAEAAKALIKALTRAVRGSHLQGQGARFRRDRRRTHAHTRDRGPQQR